MDVQRTGKAADTRPSPVRRITKVGLLAALILCAAGCASGNRGPVLGGLPGLKNLHLPEFSRLRPSNDRDWSPDQALLSYAEFHGSQVTVRNIRHCRYGATDEDYTVAHYDQTWELDAVRSVDFIVVPFNESPSLAHTMLSFGFDGGQYLAVSVEIRKKTGDRYDPVKGMLNQFEIHYVIADERDVIQLRTIQRLNDVYVHRLRLSREQAREVFVDVMHRLNRLADQPEWYHTLTNNCTTNIVDHVNRVLAVKIPYSHHVLLPGHIDRYLYDLGLLETDLPFEQARERARVNYLTYVYRDRPDFSIMIRR